MCISNELYCFEVKQNKPVELHTQALSAQSCLSCHKTFNPGKKRFIIDEAMSRKCPSDLVQQMIHKVNKCYMTAYSTYNDNFICSLEGYFL